MQDLLAYSSYFSSLETDLRFCFLMSFLVRLGHVFALWCVLPQMEHLCALCFRNPFPRLTLPVGPAAMRFFFFAGLLWAEVFFWKALPRRDFCAARVRFTAANRSNLATRLRRPPGAGRDASLQSPGAGSAEAWACEGFAAASGAHIGAATAAWAPRTRTASLSLATKCGSR